MKKCNDSVIIELYHYFKCCKMVSDELKIQRQTVYNVLNINGVKRYPRLGKKHTDESKRKIGLSNKGKKHPYLVIYNKSQASREEKRNRIVNEKTRFKISMSNKGRKRPDLVERNKMYSSTRMKEMLKKGMIGNTNTLPERKIKDWLINNSIEFIHQWGYDLGVADFFIPSENCIIEADGDYWHNYPIGTEKDKIHNNFLISKGFKVIRIWESEIKKEDFSKLNFMIKKVTE